MSNVNEFVIKDGILLAYNGSQKEVVIPDEIIGFGPRAFLWGKVEKFEGLTLSKKFKTENGLILSKDGKKLILYPPEGNPSLCIIPESVEIISGGAFRGISGHFIEEGSNHKFTHKWIEIPRTVKKIAKNAFTFVPELCGTFEFVYSPEFVSVVPFPVYLGDIRDLPIKEKNKTVLSFLDAIHDERQEIIPFTGSYVEHIQNNPKAYNPEKLIRIYKGSDNIFHFLIREKLISQKSIAKILKDLQEMGRTDLVTELLEYNETNFGKEEKTSRPFTLETTKNNHARQTHVQQELIQGKKGIKGMVFVVTGVLERFGALIQVNASQDQSDGIPDRSDLKKFIEAHGGFLRSAVSSKTDYLICNDPTSQTVKSKKAKELGIKVITENEFLKMTETPEEEEIRT